MNMTIICFMLMIVFIILLIKTKYRGSVLGKRAATVLYVIGAGFYLGLFAYSLTQDIKEVSVSANKVEEHSQPINRAKNVGTVYGEAKAEVNPKFVEPKALEPTQVKTLSSIQPKELVGTQINNNKEKNKDKVIGDKDSKIYHVPGSTYYERELQKESNNEYFNTTKEAEAAGYRAPKR